MGPAAIRGGELSSRADFDVFLKRELNMDRPLIAATGIGSEQ
jgi:hypothetical protein